MSAGRQIDIYDTTLRDGSQGEGVSLSLRDKILIARKLDELGVPYVEGGYPLSNPKDEEFFHQMRHEPLVTARLCAFGMTRRRQTTADRDVGLQALLASEVEVVALVGKCWTLHVEEVLRVSRQENLDMIAESIAHLVDHGRQVFLDAEHFFDGYRADPEYALQCLKAGRQAGAAVVVLCDTNGGRLPEQIADGVRAAREAVDAPLGIHCHNDSDLAVANSLVAVDEGVVHVQGTINGLGERCGNADLCSVIANLALKKGYRALPADALPHLTEVSRYVYELANMNFRDSQPFVGSSAFAHKGGMHVHAVQRNVATYEHVQPASVGNERRILVSELSGHSSILAATVRDNLQHDRQTLGRILERVQDLENEGYQFEAAQASFDLLVKRVVGTYRPWFETINYRVSVEKRSHALPVTEATVKLRVGGQEQHTVSEGDGPVNALDAAVRKALEQVYPNIRTLRLVDYKVRVINARAGTAARVRVTVESADQRDMWGTVGVSENIIDASWQALVDSIEYKFFKDQEQAGSGQAADAGPA